MCVICGTDNRNIGGSENYAVCQFQMSCGWNLWNLVCARGNIIPACKMLKETHQCDAQINIYSFTSLHLHVSVTV
jgi:hypothetical protein